MNPTDTIIALEKALEDQSRRLQEFAHDGVPVDVTRGQLRTLLDAHASARMALRMLYDEAADYIRLNNLGGMDNQCMRLARAALDDNTKGASHV